MIKQRLSPAPQERSGSFRPAPVGIKPYELELSLFAVFILTGVYIVYEMVAEPAGGHPFGHALGIIGGVLMVLTEVAYSLRKRTAWFDWAGPVRYWLSAHIFTGIVGPFLVLMHTGLAFRGLAGLSFLLTLIVVGSGFVGRYLYTTLPRTLGGGAIPPAVLAEHLVGVQRRLRQAAALSTPETAAAIQRWSAPDRLPQGWRAVFGRSIWRWRYRRRLLLALPAAGPAAAQREGLIRDLLAQWQLAQQLAAIESVRNWLRLWHLLHVPLGLTLFFSIAIHVVATLYFRAGLFS